MQQVLGAVGEHVVLLVERLGLLLGVALVGGHLLLDALLLCLRVARGDQSLFVLLLQLGGFGLEVLFALRPALLRLLGLLLKRYAFVLVEVALGQHGFDLNVCDVARNNLLRRRLGRNFGLRAAGREDESRSQRRKESFFHIVFWFV